MGCIVYICTLGWVTRSGGTVCWDECTAQVSPYGTIRKIVLVYCVMCNVWRVYLQVSDTEQQDSVPMRLRLVMIDWVGNIRDRGKTCPSV